MNGAETLESVILNFEKSIKKTRIFFGEDEKEDIFDFFSQKKKRYFLDAREKSSEPQEKFFLAQEDALLLSSCFSSVIRINLYFITDNKFQDLNWIQI